MPKALQLLLGLATASAFTGPRLGVQRPQLLQRSSAAEPESRAAHEARIEIYTARRATETSLMAKGIFKGAISDSQAAVSGEIPETRIRLGLE